MKRVLREKEIKQRPIGGKGKRKTPPRVSHCAHEHFRLMLLVVGTSLAEMECSG